VELFNPNADEEREQKKIRDQLKWQKCPHCGTPFKDTWGSPCPYCNGRRK
jgi:rubrerythrin